MLSIIIMVRQVSNWKYWLLKDVMVVLSYLGVCLYKSIDVVWLPMRQLYTRHSLIFASQGLRSTPTLSTLGRLSQHLWKQCCAIYRKIKVTPIRNALFLTNGSTWTLQFGVENMVASRFYTLGKAGNENIRQYSCMCAWNIHMNFY